MRRTQLYLEEDLWAVLHAEARRNGSTISDLVRRALREKYGTDRPNRKQAFEAIVGLWKNRKDIPDAENYVRIVRRGSRLDGLTR